MTEETQKPKKTDPLSVDEMIAAADLFFPRFDIVHSRMPEGSSTEDTLKVMENIAKLGHKLRGDKEEEERLGRFGFLKGKDADE